MAKGQKLSDPTGHSAKPDASGDSMDHHYGLRIEADRSWTVYHVFTGVPASVGGQIMAGLGQATATASMLSMNLRNLGRRKQRIRLDAPRLDSGEIGVPGWR